MWNFLKWIILTVHVMGLSQGYPIKQSGNGLEVPPAEVLNFMRRFGYLDKNPDNSEALYHESAIVEALKNIQKYGAINQTGKLDDMTLELFTKPRCGVPDIEGKPYYLKQHETVTMGAKHRQKRFIFGAKTWTKRNIKYLIGNRSLKIPREQVERDLARAFDVWSQYSNLKFHRVYDTSADIIVGFGSQYHGDNYPFDGAGNILAHAFYPYEMGSWGGDVHFDEDENWKENSPDLSQGVDFYTVALHELGHSLGLAHSPSHSSIMFPYYKGPDYNILDYDDTLAMYEAYLNKKLDDDDLEPSSEEQQMEDEGDDEDKDNAYNGYDEARYSTPVPVEETSKSYYEPEMSYNSTTVTTDSGYATTPMANSSYTNTATTIYNPNTEAATTTNFYPSLGTTAAIPYPTTDTISDSSPFPPPIPNICEGGFNAVCYFNGSTHIFKGQYVWKISSQYRVINGYPKLLQDVIIDLPQNILEIDACYERYDKTVLFFTGTQIWYYKDNKILDDSPVSLQSIVGGEVTVDRVDAAILWPKNNLTYIFAGSIFWRYNDAMQRLEEGYPKSMLRWIGIPNNINAATTIPNGKTYFFKDNLYWLYNNLLVRPERGYPRRASTAWLGCTTRTTTRIPLRNNTTTVTFISVSPSASSIAASTWS